MAPSPVKVPSKSYGIAQCADDGTTIDQAAEQVRGLGFATLDAGYSASELATMARVFDSVLEGYYAEYGRAFLESLDEHNTIRLLPAYGDGAFLHLALNPSLLEVLKKLIAGKFMLNQQNGIINPPGATYNQAAWHRDLPYQHFISSTPLAINALFCLDDFTQENGATFVLPASHKTGEFPSVAYLEKNAVQVTAKAGCFILLDGMTFHCGGFNSSSQPRRAINHLYNIPYFKQQINMPLNLDGSALSPEARELLGFSFQEARSLDEFFSSRKK